MAYVKGTNGTDRLDAADGVTNGADIVDGLDGDDAIYGLGGDDVLKGGGGDDMLTGGWGADTINGGPGSDTATYGDSSVGVSVSLVTGQGHFGTAEGDTLLNIENLAGSDYDDWLLGSGGDNILKGGGGTDRLFGFEGNDILKGGGGADHLDGGPGIDTVNYTDSSTWVFVSLAHSTVYHGSAEGDDLWFIENVVGSLYGDTLLGDVGTNVLSGWAGDDLIDGDDGNDTISGGDGNDKVAGGAGMDTLYGDAGNDTLAGDAGVDTMLGGAGDDTYLVDNSADVVIEYAGQGTNDWVETSVTYSLAAGSEVEVLKPTNIAGTSAIDLVGNEFDNVVAGNDGQNTIVGGLGKDYLSGHGGGDTFVWNSTAETGHGETEADGISDFNRSQGDLIALNPIDADTTLAGDQAFSFIGNAPLTKPGQISYFNNGTDTFILLNTDTDTDHEAAIRVVGIHAVDASWFVL